MKKTYIIAGCLVLAVAVLGGILLLRDKGTVEEMPQAQQEAEQKADEEKVYSHFSSALLKVEAASVAKDESLKGRYLAEGAWELAMAKESLTDKEDSLHGYILQMSGALSELGDKLTRGQSLSERDSSNLKGITSSMKSTLATLERARDEDNRDYLRGEFTLPASEREQTVSREQAQEQAEKLVEEAVFKGEQDRCYSFSGDGYILEIGKKGQVTYRKTGHTPQQSELTKDKFSQLVNSAKEQLKAKGYESTVLMEWIAAEGEITFKLYPIIEDTVYMNTPLGVTLAVFDGSLLGLELSPLAKEETEADEDLYKKLEKAYEGGVITKAVGEQGEGAYMVSFKEANKELISLWSLSSGREYELMEIHNYNYGRVAKSL